MIRRLLAAFVLSVLFARSALAAQCGGDFGTFIAAMSREAAAAGISRAVIDSALAGVTLDPAVLAFDRRQRGTFRKSFENYAATRVTAVRIQRGRLEWTPFSNNAGAGDTVSIASLTWGKGVIPARTTMTRCSQTSAARRP